MERLLMLRVEFVLFYVITVAWILEFVVFPNKFESDDFKEKRSFLIILLSILTTVSITVAFTTRAWFYTEGTLGLVLRYIGITFYLTGISLRYIGSLTLGAYFTRNVEIKADQTLISHGVYKKLRHPLYLGLFLLLVAVPLFFQNLVLALIAAVVFGLILNHRMVIEETNMARIIGDSYTEWMKSRYRFIPFIY